MSRLDALIDVLQERQRQITLWGDTPQHDPCTYLTILGEEFGELCQATLHAKFGGPAADGLYTEAVQTAAVALAIVEALKQQQWTFLPPTERAS